MYGGHLEPTMLPWAWAVERLRSSRNYWVATTLPDGRPHTRPVWGVWSRDAFHFSTGSQAATVLPNRPLVTVHLESGDEVVIIEGSAVEVTDRSTLGVLVAQYNDKYAWDVDPDNLPGPFFAVRPFVAFGWVSDPSGLDRGAAFHGTATRWRFTQDGSSAPSPG